jgi:DNA replication and repair protein RecF
MQLQKVNIIDFRNIAETSIELHSGLNFFCGENGAGKTSILEAISFLITGKSFRGRVINRIIKDGAKQFLVTGSLWNNDLAIPVGLEKSLGGKSLLHVNGENAPTHTELAALLPLQIVNQRNFDLLTAGGKYRRKIIDWGLFHVKPGFIDLWRQNSRILHQRNALLKNALSFESLASWDQKFVQSSDALHELRVDYLKRLLPLTEQFVSLILGNYQITIDYHSGWPKNISLAEALKNSFSLDRKQGFTQFGPQRADLKFLVNQVPLVDHFSRGQQKAFLYALSLAQGKLLEEAIGKRPLYLIDDLEAELSPEKSEKILGLLTALEVQALVTSLNMGLFSNFPLASTHRQAQGTASSASRGMRLFHVEQGNVSTQIIG